MSLNLAAKKDFAGRDEMQTHKQRMDCSSTQYVLCQRRTCVLQVYLIKGKVPAKLRM